MTYDDEYTGPPPPVDDPQHHDAPNVTPLRHAPQHNLHAERALIGAVLREPERAPQLLELVDPDDFYDPRHEQIWNAIAHVSTADGLSPDVSLVTARLARTGELAKLAQLLPDLATDTSSAAQATHYAREVHNTGIARRAATVLTRAQQRIHTAPIEQIHLHLADALQDLDDLVVHHAPATTATGLRDLSWLLAGDMPVVDPPTWIHRANGGCLFYAGRVNGVFGDPESAKSWLAQLGVVQALLNGQRAAIIDVDHNGPVLTTARLISLGAPVHALADPDQFRYLEPEDGAELRAAVTALVAWAPHFVVLDSIGEMMPMLGVKSTDNDELTGALRTIANPLAHTGACVVTIDHLPKGQEARTSGYAIGGTAKKRAIDGAYIYADARLPPAPGQIGKITLRIEKDRPGRLRESCQGKYVGTLVLDSTNPGEVAASIVLDTPVTSDGVFRPTGVMESISRFVEENDQANYNDIASAVAGKDTTIRAAVTVLVNEGFLSVLSGPRRSKLHHSLAAYREADDDQS